MFFRQQLPSPSAPSVSRHPLPGGMGGASGWAVNDSTPGLLRLTDRETERGERLGARDSPSEVEEVERGESYNVELGKCVVVAGVGVLEEAAAAAAEVDEEVMPEKLDLCMFLLAQVCPACLEVWRSL